jgi:hypothetical protein
VSISAHCAAMPSEDSAGDSDGEQISAIGSLETSGVES